MGFGLEHFDSYVLFYFQVQIGCRQRVGDRGVRSPAGDHVRVCRALLVENTSGK